MKELRNNTYPHVRITDYGYIATRHCSICGRRELVRLKGEISDKQFAGGHAHHKRAKNARSVANESPTFDKLA